MLTIDLKQMIRSVPDFPKPGINFFDITTLLKEPAGLKATIEALSAPYADARIETVVGIESRGFILGSAVAQQLGAGFVPVRKPGKLPHKTRRREYDLEYGTDALEMHADAVVHGARVVVVDDLLATGGTAAATVELVREIGGHVVGAAFVVELELLRGRDRLAGVPIDALLKY
jgi:adenine phosphoribosyltransferase